MPKNQVYFLSVGNTSCSGSQNTMWKIVPTRKPYRSLVLPTRSRQISSWSASSNTSSRARAFVREPTKLRSELHFESHLQQARRVDFDAVSWLPAYGEGAIPLQSVHSIVDSVRELWAAGTSQDGDMLDSIGKVPRHTAPQISIVKRQASMVKPITP